MYNILEISIPIARANSSFIAFSVSIYTASPPFFWVLANKWAPIKDLPEASSPVNSVILPTGSPPWGLLEIAKSNKEEPVDTHSVKSVGVSSAPSKKYATFIDLNFLLSESAITPASSSRSAIVFFCCLFFLAIVISIYIP